MSSTLDSDEEELVSHVRAAVRYPLMWTNRGTYDEFCALLTGLRFAPGGELFERFQAWMSARNERQANHLHWSLVLKELGYPVEIEMPELSPEEDEAARLAYGKLFEQFLAE